MWLASQGLLASSVLSVLITQQSSSARGEAARGVLIGLS